MNNNFIDKQEHGYRNGHQLLATSLKLSRDDQDTVDHLSDMSGPLGLGEIFNPYLTAYPLPSRTHYVIARTWQDLSAPRAGCVLTRSILIPMPLWETIENIYGLLPLLASSQLGQNVERTTVNLSNSPPPKVSDRRVVELFEAVFLEIRQPIVFIGATEAEAITVRLLTALWPSLRRKFAVCTYALAPRMFEGRYFDIVFAPKTARTRFSNYPVRRIESNDSRSPQHHWSKATSFQIFQSDSPNLLANDFLGVLKSDKQGDESALRLVLLWNELAAKTESTPTAVLGMLDILNSQSEYSKYALENITPKIVHAVEILSELPPEQEVWRFLITLMGKLSVQTPPKPVLKAVGDLTSKLAEHNPQLAIACLVDESRKLHLLPDVLLTGIGNGLSSSECFWKLPEHLGQLPPETGLRIFTLSREFSRSAIAMLKKHPIDWIPCLNRFFQVSDPEIKSKARQCLVPLVDDGTILPLLPQILEGVSINELTDFVVQIGNKTKFKISALDEPFKKATKDLRSLELLRDAVAFNFDNQGADRFLLTMLELNVVSIKWLCSGAIKKNRACKLLSQLLENASDYEIQTVQCEEKISECILELLLNEPKLCAPQVARVLIFSTISIERYFEISLPLLPQLEPKDRYRVEEHLLERALVEAELGDIRLHGLLVEVGTKIDPYQLIRMATANTESSRRIAENIVALEATPANIRQGICAQIYDLTERLVNRVQDNLGEAAYSAWASLIKDAASSDRDTQIRAAKFVLPYALRLVEFPVSTLIMVSFPIAYKHSLKSNDDKESDSIFEMIVWPLIIFPHWDQAIITRQSLIRDLVDSFFKSSWPPANLMLTAIDAEIEKEVIKQLHRKYKGDQYIAAIEMDSQRLNGTMRKRVMKNF